MLVTKREIVGFSEWNKRKSKNLKSKSRNKNGQIDTCMNNNINNRKNK